VTTAIDKRRVILDAAVRVFARQGFHTCRVADIAAESGVAYGLVYHYFASKEQILDTLFLERWQVLLGTIAEAAAAEVPARERLRRVAAFIIGSYSHDPDLMKVIIVEVTRAANTFGRTHQAQIIEAHRGVAQIVRGAQTEGIFRAGIDPELAGQAFFGLIEQVLTMWIFDGVRIAPAEVDRRAAELVGTLCDGLELPSA
jgi:AcrR family transcriptional regulator